MPSRSREIWSEIPSTFIFCPIMTVSQIFRRCSKLIHVDSTWDTGYHLVYSGYGTNLEGPWAEVCQAIHDCHAAVHAKGAPRVATDIRIGTRTDKDLVPGQGNAHKLQRVQEILAKDEVKTDA
ncbi:hypothetical protein HGRIS_012744 [Hohenbuehelia grisea]|uniref:Thiamine-binding protein domain-containing protein n=1 Tax=Hohenbuehelia grisea TaxID=104357 RepID=A0ABR3IT97_9AGAR